MVDTYNHLALYYRRCDRPCGRAASGCSCAAL